MENLKFSKKVLANLLRLTNSGEFTVNSKNLLPHITFPTEKLAVVIYDCELHQCPRCIKAGRIKELSSIEDECLRKAILLQLKRDNRYERLTALTKLTQLTVWQCQLADKPIHTLNSIRLALSLPAIHGEEVENRVRMYAKRLDIPQSV